MIKNLSNLKENKMGVMPINRLLIGMALPMMLSMVVQALYNVVDSIFVSQISSTDNYALTALSAAFPMQNLMIAVATGTGVGINALLSRSLGEKNYKNANRAAANGVLLGIISSVVFSIICIFSSKAFVATQTDIPEVVQYGTDYLTICGGASIGLFIQIMFERLLQSTGKTVFSMITQLIGALTNIVLDYCMIFGKFGFPEMGVKGAAAATVIGQIVAAVAGMILHFVFNKEIRMKISDLIPSKKIIGRIYRVGVPSILMASIGSVMTFCMNIILDPLVADGIAVAVFGVYFKLQSFIFMPVFGLNSGMVPIISYNYGARNPDRIKKTIKLGIIYACCIMFVGLLIFQLAPETLLQMFNANSEMITVGKTALRIISISYVFAGVCVICGTAFQALDASKYSLFVSVARQLLVLIPVAWLIATLTHNVDMVWFAFPIAEIASLTASLIFIRKTLKQRLTPLYD